ncbi:unnamed protein product [Gordionus sp. m RMFG-2023]|uniref:protein DEK-like n=1 Tax=Gordionus sp. m RMFG-2023 TaxID=3053472 RepID=UPI0030E22790
MAEENSILDEKHSSDLNHIGDNDLNDGPTIDKTELPTKYIINNLKHTYTEADTKKLNLEEVPEINHNSPKRLSPIKETELLKHVEEIHKLDKIEQIDGVYTNEKKGESKKLSKIHANDETSKMSTPKSEKEKKPLFDQPIETTGKRERKNIERLAMPDSSQKQTLTIPQGRGYKLGSCQIIETKLQKTKSEDLKILHRLLFGKPGQLALLKKHIREFNGFDFEEKGPEYNKKMEIMNKLTLTNLKDICGILNLLKKSSTKEEIMSRIMEFLMQPHISENIPDEKKKKASTSSRKSSSKTKPRKSSAKQQKGGDHSSISHDDEEIDHDFNDKNDEKKIEEENEISLEGTEKISTPKHKTPSRIAKKKLVYVEDLKSQESGDQDDASDIETTASKKRKKTNSKMTARSLPKKLGGATPPKKVKHSKNKSTIQFPSKKKSAHLDEEKTIGLIYTDTDEEDESVDKVRKESPHVHKKSNKKDAHKGKKAESEHSTLSPSKKRPTEHDEDDQPLVKKALINNSYPSEEEIKNTVQDILEGANLMEITMKTVCKKVYDRYSGYDLTPKKDFIKDTVKAVIS